MAGSSLQLGLDSAALYRMGRFNIDIGWSSTLVRMVDTAATRQRMCRVAYLKHQGNGMQFSSAAEFSGPPPGAHVQPRGLALHSSYATPRPRPRGVLFEALNKRSPLQESPFRLAFRLNYV